MGKDFRPAGSSAKRGYGSRWQRYREGFLKRHALCVMCEEQGKVVPATVVDHVKPHRGDPVLFWDPANHQPLCDPHHNSTKQRMEKSGVESGCDVNGLPLDAAHRWNR